MGFARFCVEVSASKELPDDIWICSEDKSPFKQKVVFEWKPKICLSCSSFFHLESACPSLVDNPTSSVSRNLVSENREW